MSISTATTPIDYPVPGKAWLIVQTGLRSAACEVDLGDDGEIRPLVMQTALDEALKGLQ